MNCSAASFKTDRFLKLEKQDSRMGGVLDKMLSFIEENQIYDKELWERFVEIFTFPADDKDLGWRCEYWGKMMRGAASVYAYTHDEALYAVLKGAVEGLLSTPDEEGRISSYSREVELDGWDMWGRKYVLLGLQYFCEICPEQALVDRCVAEMCRQLDYVVSHIGRGNGKKPITSASRHWLGANSCSILEPVVRLYNMTGKQEYLDFAAYIVDVCYGNENELNVFKLAFEDKLDPHQYPEQKAYETMSCFEGLIEYYRVTGEEKYLVTCVNFARRVLESEISVIGCCGCRHELFDNTRLSQVDPEKNGIMQETCVSVTWMKFCGQLLRLTGDPKYADAIEQTFFNAYLGAFNFSLRPFTYVTRGEEHQYTLPIDSYSPLRAGRRGFKIGGFKDLKPENRYYGCCVCIAPMGIGTLCETALLRSEKGVVINSYLDGYLACDGVKFRVESGYPYNGRIKITVEGEGRFELALRIPSWSLEAAAALNGEAFTVKTGYTKIDREWNNGDTVELVLDEGVYSILPPKDSPYFDRYIALRRGAITLAADKRISDPDAKVFLPCGKIEAEMTECAELPYYNLSLALKQTDGSVLRVVDYASAGSTFDEESKCAAWMAR